MVVYKTYTAFPASDIPLLLQCLCAFHRPISCGGNLRDLELKEYS